MSGDKPDKDVSPAEAQNSGAAHETHPEDEKRPAETGDTGPAKHPPASKIRPGGEDESRDDL